MPTVKRKRPTDRNQRLARLLIEIAKEKKAKGWNMPTAETEFKRRAAEELSPMTTKSMAARLADLRVVADADLEPWLDRLFDEAHREFYALPAGTGERRQHLFIRHCKTALESNVGAYVKQLEGRQF